MTLLLGRHAAVLDDDTVEQKVDVVYLDFPVLDPKHSQGVLDYCRDVLLDPRGGFRSNAEAEAHALRALVECYVDAGHDDEGTAAPKARRVLEFVKSHLLGVTVVR